MKAKSSKKPKPSPLQSKAAKIRAAFTLKDLQKLRLDFAMPVVGKAGPLTENDCGKLIGQLATAEKSAAAAVEEFKRQMDDGLASIDDWRLAQASSGEAALRSALVLDQQRLQILRNTIESIKVRLQHLQGGLVMPAMKALAAPTLEKGNGKAKVESPKDVTWLHVRRDVLEACASVAAKSDVRHYLEGVFLQSDKRELRVVSTNGHTLLLHSTQADKDLPEWLERGVILPRDMLLVALGCFGEIQEEEDDAASSCAVGFATGHASATLKDSGGVATFRLRVVDGNFPDYRKVIEAAGQVLAGGEREALTATSLAGDYVRQATAVAAKFEAKGMTPFTSADPKSPAVITFQGEPGALFLIMPVGSTAEEQLPSQTLALIGRGLEGTLAALKASQTRQRKALAESKSEPEKKQLAEAIAARELRINQVTGAIKGRLLEAPKSA
jgi:hypothetical protein